jgi:hypothetical protein
MAGLTFKIMMGTGRLGFRLTIVSRTFRNEWVQKTKTSSILLSILIFIFIFKFLLTLGYDCAGLFHKYIDATEYDVTFYAGGEKEVLKAHKIILAAGSPVFKSMFYGSLESQNEVKVPDCSPDALKSLIVVSK